MIGTYGPLSLYMICTYGPYAIRSLFFKFCRFSKKMKRVFEGVLFYGILFKLSRAIACACLSLSACALERDAQNRPGPCKGKSINHLANLMQSTINQVFLEHDTNLGSSNRPL